MGNHIVARHTIAIVFDRQSLCDFIGRDANFECLVGGQFRRVGQRLKTTSIECVRGIRDEFAQKDVFARIKAFRHHLKEFFRF